MRILALVFGLIVILHPAVCHSEFPDKCTTLLVVNEDAASSLSLSTSQIDYVSTVIRRAVDPPLPPYDAAYRSWSTNDSLDEIDSMLIAKLQEFDGALDALGESISDSQLLIARENESIDVVSKIIVIARDRRDRPQAYIDLMPYLSTYVTTNTRRLRVVSELSLAPRDEDWRLPMEYALLRPYQPGQTLGQASKFKDWHVQWYVRGAPIEIDRRTFASVYLYLCKVTAASASSGNLLGEYTSATMLIAELAGRDEQECLLDFLESVRTCTDNEALLQYCLRGLARPISRNEKWIPYFDEMRANTPDAYKDVFPMLDEEVARWTPSSEK